MATTTLLPGSRLWLQAARERPFIDSSRLAQLFQSFAQRFGDGFAQRATEAVTTYRTANWLAACVMAGAAAESVLLAVAVGKSGDEKKVLATYNSSGGRGRTTQMVLQGATTPIKTQFGNALLVMHFWRDTAAHGMATTISEIEAHASLMQLLRLAQFADDHWDRLIA